MKNGTVVSSCQMISLQGKMRMHGKAGSQITNSDYINCPRSRELAQIILTKDLLCNIRCYLLINDGALH